MNALGAGKNSRTSGSLTVRRTLGAFTYIPEHWSGSGPALLPCPVRLN